MKNQTTPTSMQLRQEIIFPNLYRSNINQKMTIQTKYSVHEQVYVLYAEHGERREIWKISDPTPVLSLSYMINEEERATLYYVVNHPHNGRWQFQEHEIFSDYSEAQEALEKKIAEQMQEENERNDESSLRETIDRAVRRASAGGRIGINLSSW